MQEIEKLRVLEDDGLINLNEFKKIIYHFKSILNQQLEFRERIEDILKIKVKMVNEHELKYILKEFYQNLI